MRWLSSGQPVTNFWEHNFPIVLVHQLSVWKEPDQAGGDVGQLLSNSLDLLHLKRLFVNPPDQLGPSRNDSLDGAQVLELTVVLIVTDDVDSEELAHYRRLNQSLQVGVIEAAI